MLDVDLSVIPNALDVPEDKIKSKGIKSVRSRVTNLKPYLAPKYQNLTTPEFRDRLLKELFHVENLADIKDKEYQLTSADEDGINKILMITITIGIGYMGTHQNLPLRSASTLPMGQSTPGCKSTMGRSPISSSMVTSLGLKMLVKLRISLKEFDMNVKILNRH